MSIGQALSAARTDAGLTLEDVADATRLRRTLVTAIENDDYALCGGDVYARGHIRNLATVIGIDPKPLLAEFDAERSPGRLTTPADAFDPRVSSDASRRRPPNWTAAMGVVLLLLLVYGGFRVLHSDGSSPQALGSTASLGTKASPSASATTRPSPSRTPTSTPAPQVTPSIPATTGVNVRVAAARGASWVRATGHDGRRIWEGTVPMGASRAFVDASELKLVIGNAGAVTLQVNGKSVGSPGTSGQVATLSYTPTDPA